MAEKVKLSKDGSSIDFVQTDNIPTSMKKFRQSPEIEGFYRFIYENDLQKEAFEILERIVSHRKSAKKALKQEAALVKKTEQAQVKAVAAAEAHEVKQAAKAAIKAAKAPVAVKAAPKAIAKPAAKAAPQTKAKTKAPVKAAPKSVAKSAVKSKAKPTTKGKKK